MSIPFFDADYFWLRTEPPFAKKRERERRVPLLREDMKGHTSWVLSGSICGWGDDLTTDFTHAVRIVVAPEERLRRLLRRERMKYGERIDPGGDLHHHHLDFIEYAKLYDRSDRRDLRTAVLHDDWQRLLRCEVITLDGSLSVEEQTRYICGLVES
jgi:hypothetical protein